MKVRKPLLSEKEIVLKLLDEFREDCIFQITNKEQKSETAINGSQVVYEILLQRIDYFVNILEIENDIVGIITGYLCPMMRSGDNRAEVEEFYVKPEYRGKGGANMLMDAFFAWCKDRGVVKINLESDLELERAHHFYKKYGFETKAKRFIKKLV